MKLRALSHYSEDLDTRFGDCILLYNTTSMIVYDCGHTDHAEAVKTFLQLNSLISQVNIIVSHNDSDHTNGVVELLDYLHTNTKYTATLYSSLYLKSAKKVLDILDDDRRTLPATKERILNTFDKIKTIIEKAKEYNISVEDATVNTLVSSCSIVGPTEDEFANVVAEAIKDNNASIFNETVMNAASVQLKGKLNNFQNILLCGDASPTYLHNLDNFDIIQLPHHGKLDSAKKIFDSLENPYNKEFLISDNTGSGEKSGGSDNLVEYMVEECYTPAWNTKDGVVEIPVIGTTNILNNKPKGVRLGAVDC